MIHCTNKNVYTNEPIDAMASWQRAVKRLIDIVGGCVGCVLFLPAIVLAYFIIRIKGGRHVIFRQERIGYRGRPFVIYKFRTMSETADVDVPELASDDDCRLAPWGKFLRDHHLDELPQLWNVIKGEMSLVGPRPEQKYFVDRILQHDARYVYLYQMRPGLTSKATLYNGYADTMEKMLRRLDMDIEYLKTRSLRLDFIIIIETLIPFLKGKKI